MAKPRSEYRKLLDIALRAAAKKKQKTLIQRAVELAYTDNTVLCTILRKVLPDLRNVEAKVTTDGPFRLIIEVAPRGEKAVEGTSESITVEYAEAKAQHARAKAENDRFKMNKRKPKADKKEKGANNG